VIDIIGSSKLYYMVAWFRIFITASQLITVTAALEGIADGEYQTYYNH